MRLEEPLYFSQQFSVFRIALLELAFLKAVVPEVQEACVVGGERNARQLGVLHLKPRPAARHGFLVSLHVCHEPSFPPPEPQRVYPPVKENAEERLRWWAEQAPKRLAVLPDRQHGGGEDNQQNEG